MTLCRALSLSTVLCKPTCQLASRRGLKRADEHSQREVVSTEKTIVESSREICKRLRTWSRLAILASSSRLLPPDARSDASIPS